MNFDATLLYIILKTHCEIPDGKSLLTFYAWIHISTQFTKPAGTAS